MDRLDQRQGFLVSAVVHMVIVTLLSSGAVQAPREIAPPAEVVPEERLPRVFLPPPEVLRQLAPAAAARPAPTPVPPPRQGKDRMSVGAPAQVREKGPMLLRREDDLTKVAKGRPDAIPEPAEEPAPASPGPDSRPAGESSRPPGLVLPPGGSLAAGEDGGKPTASQSPSIASSLRGLDRRLKNMGPLGIESGTGQQMGPLFFDPLGADFTVWVNHFKDEVYRNWIVPQAVMLGFRGHVDLEFVVLRDGTLTGLKLLKSAGTASLDKAAQNALLGSRLLPLPADYAPDQIRMQVSFYYNEAPQGS